MGSFFARNFRKPQLVPLIFIIVAEIVLLSLGGWQVQRLAWKNAQVAEIEAAQNLPALGNLPDSVDGLLYRKVMLTGSFQYDKVLHLIGRQQGGFAGYFMLTPFVLDDDGRVILVNRGFAPVGKESRVGGLQTVEGVIRPVREKRFFAPENVPEKNVWFYEDIKAISKAVGAEITPVVVEAVGKVPSGTYPIPSDGKIQMRNDHLGYAITWFSTAIIGLVMFAFYHRKKD